MNKFSEAQIMNNKIEILRKNILTASVFSTGVRSNHN